MKYFQRLIFLILIGSIACTQTIRIESPGKTFSVPAQKYELYLYRGGPADSFRAVFLSIPKTGIEVIPYSQQITRATGSFDDALSFMRGEKYHSRLNVRIVRYKGKEIGYLLIPPSRLGPYYSGSIAPNIFERNGKVYFSVEENIFYGD